MTPLNKEEVGEVKMEELDKKIAEWLFPDADDVRVESDTLVVIWRNTFAKKLESEFIDPFTTSLDACFKYIVPKLDYANIYYDKRLGYACYVDNGRVSYDETGKNLALALCKAVEKLIDG